MCPHGDLLGQPVAMLDVRAVLASSARMWETDQVMAEDGLSELRAATSVADPDHSDPPLGPRAEGPGCRHDTDNPLLIPAKSGH